MAYRLRPELEEGVRSCSRNYVIFFTVADTRVIVVRILHGAMDLPAQFDVPSE